MDLPSPNPLEDSSSCSTSDDSYDPCDEEFMISDEDLSTFSDFPSETQSPPPHMLMNNSLHARERLSESDGQCANIISLAKFCCIQMRYVMANC